MKFFKIDFIYVLIVLVAITTIDAKKHRKHTRSSAHKSKTNTKWSTTSEMGRNNGPLAAEEHGYYVKRTFLPWNATEGAATADVAPRSPPYLGIPIAWYACEGEACIKSNTAAINGGSAATAALLDGFLCDDDCVEPYDPICGKTSSELAVFYNKCKLNVAKCRTHGLWLDVAYEECKQTNPNEVAHAERKFKSSPFFRSKKNTLKKKPHDDDSSEEDITVLDVSLSALDKIGHQIAEAEAEALDEAATSTTVKSEVNIPLSKPVQQSMSLSESQPVKVSIFNIEQPMKEPHVAAAEVKPVKATDVQKVAENSVNKPVKNVDSKVTEGMQLAYPRYEGKIALVRHI